MASGSAQEFDIAVTAHAEGAIAALRAVREPLQALQRPVTNLNRHFGQLVEASGLPAIGAAAENVFGKVAHLGGTIAGLAAPLGALGGIASVGGLIEAAKGASEYGNQLYLASQKTGVAVGALARLHYVAQTTKVDSELLDKSLFRLNVTLAEAAAGKNKDAAAMFEHLHLSLHDGTGHIKTAAQAWGELSEAIRRNDTGWQDRIAKTAFGLRSAADLMPMMNLGAAGQQKLGDTFDKLHGPETDASAEAAHANAEAWDNMGLAVQGVRDAIGGALMPVITPLLTKMTTWIGANRDLIATRVSGWVTSIADGLKQVDWGKVIDGFKTVGGAMKAVFDFLGPKNSALAAGAVIFAPLITSVLGVGAAFLELGTLLAANPAGIAILAFAGLAYEIYEHWGPIKEWFSNLWTKITEYAQVAVDKISGILSWLWEHSPLKLIIDGIKWIENRRAENLQKGPLQPNERPISAHRAPDPKTVAAMDQLGQGVANFFRKPSGHTTPAHRAPDPKTVAAMDQLGQGVANFFRKPSGHTTPAHRAPDPKTVAAMDQLGRGVANFFRKPSGHTTPAHRAPDPKTVAAMDQLGRGVANFFRKPSGHTTPAHRAPDPKTVAAMDQLGRNLRSLGSPDWKPETLISAALKSLADLFQTFAQNLKIAADNLHVIANGVTAGANAMRAAAAALALTFPTAPIAGSPAASGLPSAAILQPSAVAGPALITHSATSELRSIMRNELAVKVDFENVPRGTRVRTTTSGPNPPPLDVGMRFQSGF